MTLSIMVRVVNVEYRVFIVMLNAVMLSVVAPK
jgi:hypothetical protein